MTVTLPWLLPFGDLALLLMRLLVGAVFVTSGWSHARDPLARGVFPQLGALGLILVMLGAIQKKGRELRIALRPRRFAG